MQLTDFARIPNAPRAPSAGGHSSAIPLRYSGKRAAYLKPLSRGDSWYADTDKHTAFAELSVAELGALAKTSCAITVPCENPELFDIHPDHPACISIASFKRSLPMAYTNRRDLRAMRKKARQALQQGIAADYVFRCWVGDVDRNAEGYALEVKNGRLTGRFSAFDAAASYQESHLAIDIESWPDFFAEAALGNDPVAVAARQEMARRIVAIPRAKIQAVFSKLPRYTKTRPVKPVVDYLVERQAKIAKAFLGEPA